MRPNEVAQCVGCVVIYLMLDIPISCKFLQVLLRLAGLFFHMQLSKLTNQVSAGMMDTHLVSLKKPFKFFYGQIPRRIDKRWISDGEGKCSCLVGPTRIAPQSVNMIPRGVVPAEQVHAVFVSGEV